MPLDLPVFPDAKLPDPSRPWGRDVQTRLVQAQKDIYQLGQNAGLGSKKSDSSQNRVAQQVQELGDTVLTLQDTVTYLSSFETLTAFDDVQGAGGWIDNTYHQIGDLTPTISFVLDEPRQVTFVLGAAASIAGTALVGNQIEVIMRCYVVLDSVQLPISGIVSQRQTIPDMTSAGSSTLTHNAGTSGNLTCQNTVTVPAGSHTATGKFLALGGSAQISSGLYVSDRSLAVSIANRP